MRIVNDLKYSFRLLRKTPSFTAITLVILVLGLSLYTTAYTVEQILTDKPLPFPKGDRYVALKTAFDNSGNERGLSNHSAYSYRFIEENTGSFESIAAYQQTSFVLSDGDYASTFRGAALEWEFLSDAAVSPVLGRIFNAADSIPGAEKVALISESVWRTYYNQDPNIVGRVSQLNGEPAIIIGVLPQDFQFPIFEQIWTPLNIPESPIPPLDDTFDISDSISLVAVLNEGVSIASANTDTDAAIKLLADSYPGAFGDRREFISPFVSLNQDSGYNFGKIISFITLVILALAVINLSSLLFVRSRSRQHELAVRSSVGAARFELSIQVLLESFIICTSGFLLSLSLSFAFIEALNYMFINSMGLLPFWFEMTLETDALTVGLLLTFAVWALSSLPIAVHAFKSEPASLLNSSNKGVQGQSKNYISKIVVGSEVVLSFFLLVCCGNTIFLASKITDVEFGIDTQRYMVGSFSLNHPAYRDSDERYRYTDELLAAIGGIPEIVTAAITTAPPGDTGVLARFSPNDRDVSVNGELPSLRTIWVNEGYFESLGVEITSGREFSAIDTETSTKVIVISESLATSLWPSEPAIGKQIEVTTQEETELLTIVGVTSRILQASMELNDVLPSMYRPIRQNTPDRYFLMAGFRSSIAPANLERQLRIASGEVDRNIAVDNFRLLEREIKMNQGGIDVISPIFLTFAFSTFILAGIGIYGVIARSIAMQNHEIGVRRAVGSTNSAIVFRYLKQGLAFLSVGVVVGGAAAAFATIGILSVLPSSTSIIEFFPAVLALIFLTMGGLITVACVIPARKAIGIEPGDALRYE